MKPQARHLMLLSLLVLPWFAMSAHAQQAGLLQQHMDHADFAQSGLDRLSPEQLHHLEQWLSTHAAELAASVPASDATSAKAAAVAGPAKSAGWFGHRSRGANGGDKSGSTIVSRIAGSFKGWVPGNILILQNGQQWRVIDSSSLDLPRPLENPEVTIKSGMMDSWILKVKNYNTSARVQPAN